MVRTYTVSVTINKVVRLAARCRCLCVANEKCVKCRQTKVSGFRKTHSVWHFTVALLKGGWTERTETGSAESRAHKCAILCFFLCFYILFARRCIRRLHKAESNNTRLGWCLAHYLLVSLSTELLTLPCEWLNSLSATPSTTPCNARTLWVPVRPRMPSSAERRSTNVAALNSHNSSFPIFIRRFLVLWTNLLSW